MGLSRFFIDRPVFAWVLAIAVMLAGLGGVITLPVAQYPDVAPPTVQIQASYPGASAETLETSVTQVIEQTLTGIDNLLYFSSTSDSSGQAKISATFARGTNPDVAQVQVQNKLQQAVRRLPDAVQQQGLSVNKSSGENLLVLAVYDRTDHASSADLSDYIATALQDDIARVNGVSETAVFGAPYAMRIWLDPLRLAARQLTPADIQAAVQAQNTDVNAGQVGQEPAVPGQMLNAVVKAKSRLQTPEQFRAIVVKTQPDGAVVRLGDVARVEIGQEDYTVTSWFDGHPGSGMAVRLAPGADALKTADAVKQRVAQLATNMPRDYGLAYSVDTSGFVRASIAEVIKTLVIAVVLVVLVMLVFLQSWRATLVPAIAVPVVLLGTFGVLAVLGYSLNTMSLFGMVLSIGLLVDDAIVVVENVERLMREQGLDPRAATLRSMDEIGSALVGIAVVLSAVMLPMAFFPGSAGVIYRQFSVTMITAMLLSVLVALVLSPAVCAAILRPPRQGHGGGRFDHWFTRLTGSYVTVVRGVVARRMLHLLVYAAILVVMAALFTALPTGFLPEEDQGSLNLQYTLPAGATVQRTDHVRREIEAYVRATFPGVVAHIFAITGNSNSGSGQNAGMVFTNLAPFAQRTAAADSAFAIRDRMNADLGSLRDAQVSAGLAPTIHGLGSSTGFTFELLNQIGMSRADFVRLRDRLITAANQDPRMTQVRSAVLPDTPQLRVVFDDSKLAVLGLTEADALATLSSAWGSTYIGDFVDRGRVKKVYMQSDAPQRMLPDDLAQWYVRPAAGSAAGSTTMVPFSVFTATHWENGANTVSRFDGLSSYEISGQPASGRSSGEAMQAIAALQRQLAPGTSYAWSGLSYQEQQTSGQAGYLYAAAILAVFLCLAALYESWTVPLAVLMAIPLGAVGAVLAVSLRGLENNIQFQVGLLTTIGLAAKNAILIIEFAERARRAGEDPVTAVLARRGCGCGRS